MTNKNLPNAANTHFNSRFIWNIYLLQNIDLKIFLLDLTEHLNSSSLSNTAVGMNRLFHLLRTYQAV